MSASVSFVPAMTKARNEGAVNTKEYRELLGKSLPRVISTERENEYYTRLLEELDSRHKDLTPALSKIISCWSFPRKRESRAGPPPSRG